MPKRKAGSNRRDDILQAAEYLMRTRGLAGVTTRAIAHHVGCSEGALYVHFKGRLPLLLAVLEECLPNMLGPLAALEHAVGQRTPEANLVSAIKGIYQFQRRVVPMFGSLFAEAPLLRGYQRFLRSQNRGPHRAVARIAAYIKAEQGLGRLGVDIDPEIAAAILMSSCFWKAFTEQFLGMPVLPPWPMFSKRLITSVIGGCSQPQC
jgi:AcrR family transcriptional regulator